MANVSKATVPVIMGILNVTPDSFSDGGRFFSSASPTIQAIGRVQQLFSQGADVVDIGAESTRPGALPASLELESARLIPVLDHLNELQLINKISVDTYKPDLMLKAAKYNVGYINNVGSTPSVNVTRELATYPGLNYIAMHCHGTPLNMQNAPLDGQNSLKNVGEFFARSKEHLLNAGFTEDRIWHDPGIGFGKTDQANLLLIREIPNWTEDYQVIIGLSRKSLIGRLLDIENPLDRDLPSKMLELGAAFLGAKMIRTHEVSRLAKIFSLLRGGLN